MMPNAPRNLLPNASFELDFGDRVPTNWADTHNELTIRLPATNQSPKVLPRSEAVEGAVDGERAARLENGRERWHGRGAPDVAPGARAAVHAPHDLRVREVPGWPAPTRADRLWRLLTFRRQLRRLPSEGSTLHTPLFLDNCFLKN
jgi:hypothetical protein